MSKSQSVIVFVLLVVLFLLVGFLTWRFMDFQSNYLLMTNQQTKQVLSAEDLKKEMKDLKTKLEAQKNQIFELKKSWEDFSKQAKQQFISSPEYAVDELLFTVRKEETDENQIQIIGNLKEISSWEERNKFFLDYILQESLVLDYSNTKQRLVVGKVIPGSYYYQMGLRSNDIIEKVDGRLITNTDELRARLLQPQPKKVTLKRADQTITLNVKYEESHPNKVQLDLSKEEFRKDLESGLKGIQLLPVTKDGKVIGVKIAKLEPVSLFALMNFQEGDVIQKINGKNVMANEVVGVLKEVSELIRITFQREDEVQEKRVEFKK